MAPESSRSRAKPRSPSASNLAAQPCHNGSGPHHSAAGRHGTARTQHRPTGGGHEAQCSDCTCHAKQRARSSWAGRRDRTCCESRQSSRVDGSYGDSASTKQADREAFADCLGTVHKTWQKQGASRRPLACCSRRWVCSGCLTAWSPRGTQEAPWVSTTEATAALPCQPGRNFVFLRNSCQPPWSGRPKQETKFLNFVNFT